MKYLILISTFVLMACVEKTEEKTIPKNTDNIIHFTVLKATVDENDISDVSIFCIDGVKYLVIPGIGVTVKYHHDGSNDPYPETCVNQPVKN